jgi:hypothetical protein
MKDKFIYESLDDNTIRHEYRVFFHEYKFSIKGHTYIVKLHNPYVGDQYAAKKTKDDYVVDFYPEGKSFYDISGFGNFYMIINNIVFILRDFYSKNEVRKFIFEPIDKKRYNIFLKIIPRLIPSEWGLKYSDRRRIIKIYPSKK